MTVTEQIDAMRALGTDPVKKLVTPRVVSAVIMMFFLTILADICGLTGGAAFSTLAFGIDWHQYWSTSWQILVFQDVFMGLLKPVLFGFIIATVGCHYGLTAHGGTQGVGRATTQSVVVSSLLIIVVDLLTTRLLMTLFAYH
jgi:phospholipid/cholesterol/gamma-HCH transport system permease protein